MKLNFHTSLGLPELINNSLNRQYIMFSCWANTRTTGSYKGVRDAMPGLLGVLPYDNIFTNYKNPTALEVEQLFQNSDRTVIFPFSVLNNGKPRVRWSVPGDVGVILNSITPITWPYDSIDVVLNKFDDFNFNDIIKQLYTSGPVSVVVKSSYKLLSGLCTFTKEIKDSFKYTNMIYNSINKLSLKDLVKHGSAEFRMSFFKPSQCLPFFGKNHGAVVHISITQSKYSSAVGSFSPLIEMIGLFTDNTDAFIDVDGSGNIYGNTLPFDRVQKIIKDNSAAFDHVGEVDVIAM